MELLRKGETRGLLGGFSISKIKERLKKKRKKTKTNCHPPLAAHAGGCSQGPSAAMWSMWCPQLSRSRAPQSCEYREFSISGVSFEWKEAMLTPKSAGRRKRAIRSGAELHGLLWGHAVVWKHTGMLCRRTAVGLIPINTSPKPPPLRAPFSPLRG